MLNCDNSKYVYVYLNPLKPGEFKYDTHEFKYEPFYVGMGTGNRYKMHMYESKLKGKSHKINTIKQIINDDEIPIIIKLYENLSTNDAKELEIKMIKMIGRCDLNEGSLTNQTNGGDSCGYKHNKSDLEKSMNKIICYDVNMKILSEYESIQDASINLNVSRGLISQSCRHLIKICKGKYIFRYEDSIKDSTYKIKNNKITYKILRIDYKGNVEKYNKIIEASNESEVSENTIVKVCKGRYLNGGKYLWEYINYDKSFYNDIQENYGFNMNVKVIDSNGNIYENALHASNETIYRLYTICQNLNGKYELNDINFKYLN